MTPTAAGYSGTPLVKKLGIKEGMRLVAPGRAASLPHVAWITAQGCRLRFEA